mgnify:FL=1
MNWSRLFVFMLMTVGLAGSGAGLIADGMIKFKKVKNPYFIIVFLQSALVLYIVPVLFAGMMLDRINLHYSTTGWRIGTDGVFLVSYLHVADQIGILAGIIWGAGCFCKIIRFRQLKMALNRILQNNAGVSDGKLREITEEYRLRFHLRRLMLYENDGVLSPVSIKHRGYIIIIPKKRYSEKEYRMILEHECNHIKRRDVIWRKMAVIAECINWYNPLVKWVSRQLIYYQEVRCDLQSISSGDYFTPREYGVFLAGLSDSGLSRAPLTAFCESKSMLIGRLEMMKQAKQMKKVNRGLAFAAAAGFIAVSLLPANVVSAQVIRAEEQMIYASEVAVEVPMMEQKVLEEKVEYAGNDVNEIDLSEDIVKFSDTFLIDIDISGNTRSLLDSREMVAGSSILISTNCGTNSTYRIGIKNESTGKLTYVEGTGVMTHTFKISDKGKYAPYVENKGSQTIHVTGHVEYQ